MSDCILFINPWSSVEKRNMWHSSNKHSSALNAPAFWIQKQLKVFSEVTSKDLQILKSAQKCSRELKSAQKGPEVHKSA